MRGMRAIESTAFPIVCLMLAAGVAVLAGEIRLVLYALAVIAGGAALAVVVTSQRNRTRERRLRRATAQLEFLRWLEALKDEPIRPDAVRVRVTPIPPALPDAPTTVFILGEATDRGAA